MSSRWIGKFRYALCGLVVGVRGQNSFAVHFLAAICVVAAAAALHVDSCQWCLLILSMASVVAAELFNGAVESMAKAVTDQNHPLVGNSLDIAAGAVLVTSLAPQ